MSEIGPQRATPKSLSAIKAELKQGISVMVTPIRITEDGHYLVDQNGILIAWATKELAEKVYGVTLPEIKN
jgi:hypothetical protein